MAAKTDKRARRRATASERRRRTGGKPGRLTQVRLVAARVLLWACAVTVATGTGAGVIWGCRYLLFTGNPHFTLRKIEVAATGQMRAPAITALVRRAGVVPDETNLFVIDLAELRVRLEQQTLVNRATVARRLPDTLAISIYEREPIAQFKRRGRLLLDAEGRLLPPRRDAKAVTLPVITGIRGGRDRVIGNVVSDKVVLAALRFLELVATRPDGRYYEVRLVQLDYAYPSLTVHLGPRGTFRKGARVVVPVRGMEDAIDRMTAIVQQRAAAGETTYFIDATYEIKVPVRG